MRRANPLPPRASRRARRATSAGGRAGRAGGRGGAGPSVDTGSVPRISQSLLRSPAMSTLARIGVATTAASSASSMRSRRGKIERQPLRGLPRPHPRRARPGAVGRRGGPRRRHHHARLRPPRPAARRAADRRPARRAPRHPLDAPRAPGSRPLPGGHRRPRQGGARPGGGRPADQHEGREARAADDRVGRRRPRPMRRAARSCRPDVRGRGGAGQRAASR